MFDDLTTFDVQLTISGGMTTAICYVGGNYRSSSAVALGQCSPLCILIDQRVAEAVGNVLVYPPNPYTSAVDSLEKIEHIPFTEVISL